jgi:formylglycine-generating enzyme required for sulfatase activity
LTAIPDLTIPENAPFERTVEAVDVDLPPQSLTFWLDSAPTGMSIHPSTGLIRWTPSEDQGPGVHPVVVRVRDGGTPPLESGVRFSIAVTEVENPPVVPRIVGFREIGGGDLDFDVDATAGREWVLEDSRILGNWSEVSRFLANQQRFSLRVPYQSSNSRFFRLRQAEVGGRAPVIIQQPQDLTVRPVSNAVFTVVAEGTGPLVYQWFFDGATIPGSRQSTLILTNVQSLNAGNYWVSVTNSVGSVTSSPAKLTVDLGEPIGTEGFVWIPPGTFLMGSPLTERDRSTDETQHTVELTQGFFMGRHEVTQAEYQAVMTNNPSWFKGTNLPVEHVSWIQATNYCGQLTERERLLGRLPEGWEYRLPTVAQWEYACRAGTTTATAFGNSLSSTQANFAGNYSYNGGVQGPYLERTTPVGSYTPNAWGLYDMHGNVWEWCADWYGDYPTTRAQDPQGPATGVTRVARGGSWVSVGADCRSARRYRFLPGYNTDHLGFRVVRVRVR